LIEGDVFAIAKVLQEGKQVHHDSPAVGVAWVKALRAKLNRPGTGRLYTTLFFTDAAGKVHSYGKRSPHRASAPGEPPAKDSGNLRDSTYAKPKRVPDGAEVEAGSKSQVAAWQEYGTQKIFPRPWFRPTLNEVKDKLFKIWTDGIVRRERAKARSLGGRG